MNKQLELVKEFQKLFGHPVSSVPTTLTSKQARLRFELMKEENEEFLEACDNYDKIEMLDALGDMMYILCGTILECGMQDKIVEAVEEIHKSNLSKLDEEGNAIFREDGKVLKSDSYIAPNLEKVLYGSTKKED